MCSTLNVIYGGLNQGRIFEPKQNANKDMERFPQLELSSLKTQKRFFITIEWISKTQKMSLQGAPRLSEVEFFDEFMNKHPLHFSLLFLSTCIAFPNWTSMTLRCVQARCYGWFEFFGMKPCQNLSQKINIKSMSGWLDVIQHISRQKKFRVLFVDSLFCMNVLMKVKWHYEVLEVYFCFEDTVIVLST